jgi:hypothetical protein
MKRHLGTLLGATAAAVLFVSVALRAQDKSIKVPDGLAVSDFKGYETWETIAPSYTDHGTKVILGNPIMMTAYRDGIPANGKFVPDGAMMAKVDLKPVGTGTACGYECHLRVKARDLVFTHFARR